MRSRSLGIACVLALIAATGGYACGGGGSGTGAQPDGAAPGDDASGDDGAAPSLTYSPQGCKYTYTPPSRLGYLDLALDDTGPVDPTQGAPQRVRLGLGGGTQKGQAGYADPTTSATFTWETAASNHAAKVKLGTSATALSQTQSGYTWTLKPTLGSNAFFHEVHVCGLAAGTTYFYQVGGGPSGAEVWSATQSFTTAPATGSITVGVFGDSRDQVATWQAVHLRMRDAGVAMSLVGGDVVDIGGEETLYGQWLDAIWKDPSDPTKFLTLGQQYIVPVNGNHENDTATSFANWAIPGDGDYAETYASFDLGNTHFTMIDDQQLALAPTGAEAMAQLAWLDQDLSAAAGDRANHPFVVVVGHRCLFSTSTHGSEKEVTDLRGLLVPVFDKYAVDLVINGHDHDYERSKPLKAGSPPNGDPVVGAGTTYVVSAGAGADAYPTGTAAAFTAKSVAYGSGTSYIGAYSMLTLSGNTLRLDAYGLRASASTVAGDDPIDTLTLTH
jgi:hypothetical protein